MKPTFVSLVTPRSGCKKCALNLFRHQSGRAFADFSSVDFTNWRHFSRCPGKKRLVRGKQILQLKRLDLHAVTQITCYFQNSLARDTEQD